MKSVAHIDANYFYGQVEALHRPSIRGKAFIVGGDQESRKGIVLTKSPAAKAMGIQTGSSVHEALGICPSLIVVPANYPLYAHFSRRMREIVLEHTDTIKPFGSDEMWASLYGNRKEAMQTVHEIRRAIMRQLCLTVSIGVGNNLPYAKLGSDLAPNNGIFEAWNDEREKIVYPLPVSDLLYVGYATTAKFHSYGIYTIGGIVDAGAQRVCEILKSKTGAQVWTMAAGLDNTPVTCTEVPEKSISCSNTMPRDLVNEDDVRAAFYMLGETVATRMRESGCEAATLSISLRDNDLHSISRQVKLPRPTNLTAEIVPAAMALFRRHYRWHKPIRSLGICAADLLPQGGVYQPSFFDDERARRKREHCERAVDRIRTKFGHYSLRRAVHISERLKSVNANNDIGDAVLFYSY
jgi:DNA polymerase-4